MRSCISIEYDSHDWNTQKSLNYQYFFFPKAFGLLFGKTLKWSNLESSTFDKKAPLKIYLAPEVACSHLVYFGHCA